MGYLRRMVKEFKQAWKADGYSLGDLLYSLPLAPCQEKQIAIIDWDRSERAARTESQDVSKAMQADISHDRDISEIISSSFREDISASSLSRLQDNVSQSASSLRTQRNTVIQTVGQNENMTVQTEVVRNNNHCHALTVEYFEVLKHYAIERIANNYTDSDLPTGTYADEPIEDLYGNFSLTFDLKRPYISEIDEATKTETFICIIAPVI